MTDHEKLLCMLLSENEDRAREGIRPTTSPLRVVAVMLGRRECEPEPAK